MRAPRILGLIVGSIALAAFLFLFVLPSRTYLQQRQSLASAQTQLKVLQNENTNLAASARQLQTNAEVERIARQQYGLVMPGDRAFVIEPPPSTVTPPAAPAKKATPGLASRLWHDVQFWH